MKKYSYLLFFVCLHLHVFGGGLSIPQLEPSNDEQTKSAITYDFSGGRLGDNLVAYFHAKWLSYRLGLAFLFKPFPHAEKFELIERDQLFSDDFRFKNKVVVRNIQQIDPLSESTLYVVPYSPECRFEYEMLGLKWLPIVNVDWKDPCFLQEVKACLTPKKTLAATALPKGKVSVALHVRRGGGIDAYPASMYRWPLKFPPDTYYIQQLKWIANVLKKPLYVYIFTDDLHPEKIAATYKKALHNKKITFDYRKENNTPNANLLEDFFAMSQFDCLVLCQSNYSLMASKIGNYKIKIYPTHSYFLNGQVIVDGVERELGGK